MVHYEFD